MATQDPHTDSFREILVATDFSDASVKALGYAVAIARRFQARIKLVHVSKPVSQTVTQDSDWFEEEVVREADSLEALTNSLREDGLSVDAVNAVGDIKSEILACIERDSADLVVVGTHGKKGIKRLLFGSEAEDLARRVACPVLVVGPASRALNTGVWSPEAVLCATDADHEHGKADEYAYSLARSVNAALTTIAVRNGDTQKDSEIRGPASTIVRIARERNADLIVMGATESHWPVSHFGKGVLAGVFASAPCPVLTIKVH